MTGPMQDMDRVPPEALDRAIVVETQAGLPLCHEPYHELARRIGVEADQIMRRLRAMQQAGTIRRIGAVPNHYALGYGANGMSVWDIPDQHVGALGRQVGGLDFVTHCYRRPRRPPDWPYNLFAVVHGKDRDEVTRKVARIAELLGDDDRGHDVLYSTRILKKTGLRLGRERA
jgi:DNA-binding Lrp family transcriptional regulator